MSKTEKLLDQISETGHLIGHRAMDVLEHHDSAEYAYSRLSCEDNFIGHESDVEYLTDDLDDAITEAAEYMQDARVALGELDTMLMKLIKLRGKLAEEIGVPIGGKQWVRYETFTM
jgi:hypothetical protein